MKPKILVTREVFDETLAYLVEHCEVESNQADTPFDPATLAQQFKDKDGVVCCLTDRIDDALLAKRPRLKVVANIAVGYNNIDVSACTARGVMVTNTPGVLDDSTADLAFTLILATARRLTEAEAYVRAGNWQGWHLKQMLGVDVHHATLGIIGMGRIGQQIARRAAGFKMRVLYHNRNRWPADVEKWLNAEYATKEQLLAQADFEPLRSEALRQQVLIAALGACVRQPFLVPAVMTSQAPVTVMNDQTCAATRAARRPATFDAEQ